MIKADHKLILSWADQICAGLTASKGRTGMGEWLEDNTAHPADSQRRWSWADHEWMKSVISCPKNHISIEKSAQVGASELTVRWILGLAITTKVTGIIYTLPTAAYMRSFVASRVDPVIRASPLLRSLTSADANNLSTKEINGTFLHFYGASKVGLAISTPAQVLVADEINHCNQGVLSTFQSRLGHCKPGEDLRISFSTPTLPGFGVSKLYAEGDGHAYLCKHDVCGDWVEIVPWNDIMIPGFDGNLLTLTPRDLEDVRVRPAASYVKCPHCGDKISQGNLEDPRKRRWVAKFPDREEASFRVTPLDCAAVNPPAKIVGRVKEYGDQQNFLNYGLGLPASNALSMILVETLDRLCTEGFVPPNVGANGCVMGVDVGKTSHLVIGKQVGGVFKLLWLERIVQTGEDTLYETVKERMAQFGVARLVIDSQPDLSTPLKLIENSWAGNVLASYFVGGAGPRTLDLYTVDEDSGVIKIARTRAIDHMVRELNGGKARLLRDHPEMSTFINHVSKLRRVEGEEVDGQVKGKWVSTDSEDHYAFALLYCMCAAHSLGMGVVNLPGEVFSGKKIFSRVKLRLV